MLLRNMLSRFGQTVANSRAMSRSTFAARLCWFALAHEVHIAFVLEDRHPVDGSGGLASLFPCFAFVLGAPDREARNTCKTSKCMSTAPNSQQPAAKGNWQVLHTCAWPHAIAL